MKHSAKIIGLVLAILLLSTTILFSYPSIREGAYTLGQWYNKIVDWSSLEKPDAYNFKVHPWLALRAIRLFELTYAIELTPEQKRLIILGSIEEDYDLQGTSGASAFSDVKGSIESEAGDILGKSPVKQCERSINHFMDVNGDGLVPIIGTSALLWATSDERNYTRYSKAEELAKSGDKNGWRYLGHVLHLLQDMATPAHVRNDQHAVGDDNYETILGNVGNVNNELGLNNYHDLLSSLPAYPVTVIEPKINNFFINLSEFTRNNYYSDNSFNKSGYVNPSLMDGGDGYCYNEVNGEPYKQGVAYHITGKNCNHAKIDAKTVKVMFPALGSKAIAYGAGLIKLFYDSVPNVVQDQYTMSGTIHSGSNSGPVLSGVTVSIASLTATTSSTGTFSITGIPAGTYKLSISKSGYDTYTNSAYYIDSDKTGLNFYLTKTVVIPTDNFPIGTWDAGKWGSFTVTKLVQTSGSANYYSGSITYSTFGTKSVTGAATGGNIIMLGNSGTTLVVLAQDYGTLNPTVYNFTATVNPSHGGYAVGEYIWGSLIITTNVAGASYNGQYPFTKTN